jgi:hypothetical protein
MQNGFVECLNGRLRGERLNEQTALEPQRPHTSRVRSTPRSGAKLEQTLLINEDKLGSGSMPITFSMMVPPQLSFLKSERGGL